MTTFWAIILIVTALDALLMVALCHAGRVRPDRQTATDLMVAGEGLEDAA